MPLQYNQITIQSEECKFSPSLVFSGGNRIAMWFHGSKVEQTFLGREETWVLVLTLPLTHCHVSKSFPFSRWILNLLVYNI